MQQSLPNALITGVTGAAKPALLPQGSPSKCPKMRGNEPAGKGWRWPDGMPTLAAKALPPHTLPDSCHER
jgi:hypothetical protein